MAHIAVGMMSVSLAGAQTKTPPDPAPPQNPVATPTTQAPTTLPAQGTPAKPAPAPQTAVPETTPGFVTNVFVDTDIKVALSEAASQAGVTVIIDDSIKEQNISIEFKNTPIKDVLDRLSLFVGGVWKEKSDGLYIFSTGKPESPLFHEFATTRRYIPANILVESLAPLLPPSFKEYVQTDTKTNTLTITAPEQRMGEIFNALRAIDAPFRQIVVEALITEIDANTSAQFGFSWNWKNFGQSPTLGLNYTTVSPTDFAQVMALLGRGAITLRANPRISAFEGRESMISVGQETYFPIITSGNAQFQSAQVQLIRTGVILKFTGFIGDDGTITLVLNPEVSDDFETVSTAPTTKIRRVSSTVRVHAGDTIAIGGLVQENISDTRSKIPFLGDLPVIGSLFRTQTTTHRKLETIIFVTPYLSELGAGAKGKDSPRPLIKPQIEVPGVKKTYEDDSKPTPTPGAQNTAAAPAPSQTTGVQSAAQVAASPSALQVAPAPSVVPTAPAPIVLTVAPAPVAKPTPVAPAVQKPAPAPAVVKKPAAAPTPKKPVQADDSAPSNPAPSSSKPTAVNYSSTPIENSANWPVMALMFAVKKSLVSPAIYFPQAAVAKPISSNGPVKIAGLIKIH